MIVDSKFFGRIEICDDDIIHFDEGLFGFEDIKKYVLMDISDNSIYKCLQSIDRNEIAFIVISPWDVEKEYQMDIDDAELVSIGNCDLCNLVAYSIVTISSEGMTANMVGPVIINAVTKKAKQVILNNSQYSTKHIIKRFEKKE